MTPDIATPGTDAVNIVILSSWFSGIPFAYIAYLLNRKLGWKSEDYRLVLLSLAVGIPLLWLLMRLMGNTGVWPAAFAMIGWYGGLRYGAVLNERRRRRRLHGPDPTQRLLFEQMTKQAREEKTDEKDRK
jgi:hypothetical protein